MNLFYCVIVSSLFVFNGYIIHTQFIAPPRNLNEYDAYGSLLTMNEYLAIIAQNDQEHFTIITYPFTNRSEKCIVPYNMIQHSINSLTRFVYNVAIGTKQNESQLIFSCIDENWRREVFLTVVFLEFTNTSCVRVINQITFNMTDLNMQEHALVGMDPHGKRAYAVGTYYIVCIEIETDVKYKIDAAKMLNNEDNYQNLYFPKALVVTEDHYILAVGQKFINLQFLPYLVVLNFVSLSNITLLSSTQLWNFNFGPSSTDITRSSIMSISFLDQVEWFIVGIPYLDMLFFLSWNSVNSSKEPIILQKHISSQKGILFGKSVVLLDNTTFAVLAQKLPTLPWSTSQVQIFSFNNEKLDSRPLIVYPNNQQIIPSVNLVSPPHIILTIVSWNSHLGLVLDAGAALLLSASPPGYCSAQIDDYLFDMDVYESIPCIQGTARNTTSFGPCFLCPPNTKNNGTSRIECEICTTNDSLLCLRGTSIEIPLDNVRNYNQAVPYPNAPELVDFDEIILQNIFSSVTKSSHCLVVSPLFWASLGVALGFIMFIIMCILICFPRWKPHRTFLKKLFTHLDLIGEGEVWFGGLLTFSLVVFFAFVCKFSVAFARLYPIESISSDDQIMDPCNSIIPNAKFTSGLQLLAILRREEEKLIFTMLDEQDIHLNVQFVSTGFLCPHVNMQQNLDQGQHVPTDHFNCSFDNETNILSISTLLSEHRTTLQFDLIGPYFIGGLRICLSGPSDIKENNKYTLQELRFCHFFYLHNNTLTINPTVDIKMTRVINRTMGYSVSDNLTFSGIWIPMLTISALSDTLLFDENGEFVRYLSDRVTLVVDITESEFFMQNIQEPIARQNEIVLHTILLAMVFLELFGLFFLFVKLTIVPFVKLIQRRFFSNKDHSLINHDKHVRLVRFRSSCTEETLKPL